MIVVRRICLCFALMWLLPSHAQVSTPAPFLNVNPDAPLREEAEPSSVDKKAHDRAAPEMAKPLAEVSINVSRFDLNGVDAKTANDLEARLRPYVGQGKSFEDLSNAAQVVTAYMQSEVGYYLAYAYLPAQNITQGVVRIEVLPGILEAVEVNWPDTLRVNREVIESHLRALKPGAIIKVSDVERVVFLLNDLRGIRMTFAIKPGKVPGQAILVASPINDRAVVGSVGIDANGSRFAGTYRGIASVSIESPFGLGDSLSFSHLKSETGGLDFTLLGYTVPIGSDGLKVGANFSTVNYKLNANDFPLGLNGDAQSVGVFALYPLVRSRNLNVFALAGADQKKLTDRQTQADLETSKDIDAFRLALNGDARDGFGGGGLTFFSLAGEKTKVHYPGGRPFGLDDKANGMRVNYSIGRLQSVVPGRFMLWTYARGQNALDNLDSSEQCSLGGATAVRAFAQGETSGDSCDLFTIEARYIPSEAWLGSLAREVSFNVFYDEGRVQFRNDPSARPSGFQNHAELVGYGIGLAWDRPNVFTFNMSLAWELEGVRRSDPKPQSPRIFASYIYYF